MYTGRHRTERQYEAFILVFSLTALSLFVCVCVFTDDLLGKRRSLSPNSSSECPSDSKKSRSVSPKGKTMWYIGVVMTLQMCLDMHFLRRNG